VGGRVEGVDNHGDGQSY
jgi:hypothetical protein